MTREAGAFGAYFARRNRAPRQLVLLAMITVASCAIGAIAKEWATGTSSFGMVVDYHILRWGMGELLWCWLAADHAFSELHLARRQGRMADWRATPNDAPAIARSFADETYRLLVPVIVLFALGDAVHPYGGRPLAFLLPQFPEAEWAFRWGTPACMGVAHLATARLAVLVTTADAFAAPPTVARWGWCLARLGWALAAVKVASLLGAYALAACLPHPGGAMWGGLALLRVPWRAPVFLCGVLVFEVLLKWALARGALRRLSRIDFPPEAAGPPGD